MNLARTLAVITNDSDSIIAYTNGIYVANIDNDPMPNGTNLNPSIYTDQQYGLLTANSHVMLPWPGSNDSIAMFHMATDSVNSDFTLVSRYLYMSVIDMTMDGGKGDLVEKNTILQTGEYCTGGVSAVKHGNGRDWWIYFHKCRSDEFVRFLLTPEGLSPPEFQAIGEIRIGSVPSGVFSSDGSRFAYVDAFSDLDVFEVDRCTGTFYSHEHAHLPDGYTAAFAAFAPAGQFLYVTFLDTLYQFDVIAPNIEQSRVIVAEWDSTYDPSPPFATLFFNVSLAPDGKIYVSTGNSTRYMHVINQPDNPGISCDVLQNAHYRQTLTNNSIPSRPNYYLGALQGSPCDTLGVGIDENEIDLNLSLFPNPNEGQFNLSFAAMPEAGILEIHDLNGRMIHSEPIAPWSTFKRVQLDNGLAKGLYQCRLVFDDAVGVVRFVVE